MGYDGNRVGDVDLCFDFVGMQLAHNSPTRVAPFEGTHNGLGDVDGVGRG